MRLAVISLNTERKNLGQYYNSQADGMAKAFAAKGHTVTVYHLVPDLQAPEEQTWKNGVCITYLRCRHLGKHALPDFGKLDQKMDCYVTASDNYIALGSFRRWCRKNGILCLPYIGVIHSNNASAWKRKLVDLFCDNTKYYKKMCTVVKTPALAAQLEQKGAKKVHTVPVGLDTELLKADYAAYDAGGIKKKWNYSTQERVILFVGRMIAEKDPLSMIRIFQAVHQENPAYRLLMVGQGELLGAVKRYAEELGLLEDVAFCSQLPNDRMWELYRIADCFVNLNTHEIFGMAILEAMYYGCTVIALRAPGPEFIIEDGISGFLADTEQELAEKILDNRRVNGKNRVLEQFVWEKSAGQMLEIINGNSSAMQK